MNQGSIASPSLLAGDDSNSNLYGRQFAPLKIHKVFLFLLSIFINVFGFTETAMGNVSETAMQDGLGALNGSGVIVAKADCLVAVGNSAHRLLKADRKMAECAKEPR